MKKTFYLKVFFLPKRCNPQLFRTQCVEGERLLWLFFFFLFFGGMPDNMFSQCNGLQFDGENDYVQANSPFSDNSDFTLEMWFRSDNTDAGGVCNNNSLPDFRWLACWDDNNFGIGECNGNLRFVFKPTCPIGAGLCLSLATVPIQDGAWHHVAFAKNAGSIRILVDGNLLTSFGSGFYNLSGFYRLGRSGSGAVGKNWLGAMDEVRIWNVARTDAQIQAGRNCQLAWNEPGLVTLFRANIGFPEGPNPDLKTLDDLSSSNQNGTLMNFALVGPTSNWVSGPEAICDAYCTPPAGEITQLSPIGEVHWATGDPKTFTWTKAAGYSGVYRLKIKKLAAAEEAPLKLPDTGLFYDNADISDTSFTLPLGAPAFDTLARYAWQVETVGTVGGLKKSGGPIIIIIINSSLNLSVGAIPTTTLCPGDCFFTTVTFSPSFPFWYQNRLLVYTDFSPNVLITVPPLGNVLSTDFPAYPLPIIGPLPTPLHYAGLYNSKTVKVCATKGRNTPIELDFYGYRNGNCSSNPLGFGCNHDVEMRTINVANVPNYS